MADFTETSAFPAVEVLETTDKILGGVAGDPVATRESAPANKQAQSLTQRTRRLYNRMSGHARNSLYQGPADADGLPSWATISGSDLEIDCTSDPVLFSFSEGWDEHGAIETVVEYKGSQTLTLTDDATNTYFIFAILSGGSITFEELADMTHARPYIIHDADPGVVGTDGFWFNPSSGKMYRVDALATGWDEVTAVFCGFCRYPSVGVGILYYPAFYGCTPFDGIIRFRRHVTSTEILNISGSGSTLIAPAFDECFPHIESAIFRNKFSTTAYAAGSDGSLNSDGKLLHSIPASFVNATGAVGMSTSTDSTASSGGMREGYPVTWDITGAAFTTGDGEIWIDLSIRWIRI